MKKLKIGQRVYIKHIKTIEKMWASGEYDYWLKQVPGDWKRAVSMWKRHDKQIFGGYMTRENLFENYPIYSPTPTKFVALQIVTYQGELLHWVRCPIDFLKD